MTDVQMINVTGLQIYDINVGQTVNTEHVLQDSNKDKTKGNK